MRMNSTSRHWAAILGMGALLAAPAALLTGCGEEGGRGARDTTRDMGYDRDEGAAGERGTGGQYGTPGSDFDQRDTDQPGGMRDTDRPTDLGTPPATQPGLGTPGTQPSPQGGMDDTGGGMDDTGGTR